MNEKVTRVNNYRLTCQPVSHLFLLLLRQSETTSALNRPVYVISIVRLGQLANETLTKEPKNNDANVKKVDIFLLIHPVVDSCGVGSLSFLRDCERLTSSTFDSFEDQKVSSFAIIFSGLSTIWASSYSSAFVSSVSP